MHNKDGLLSAAPRTRATRRKRMQRFFAQTASRLLLLSLTATVSPSFAEDLPTDSVLLTKHVNKAAEYYDKGEFARAKEEYLAVITQAPNSVEPYEGLLQCSQKIKDWPQVAFAASKITTLNPEREKFYEYDYGTALFNLNKYDEAVPHLKSALATADIPPPVFKPIRLSPPEGNRKSDQIMPVTLTPAPTGTSLPYGRGELSPTQIEDFENHNTVTSKADVDLSRLENFDNAIRSESICIAEYQGCEKGDDIRFNSPPATYWHIDKILKGPPLNRHLPLRYDFHTLNVEQQPPGWKFDQSLLPTKGSKWILFIEFAMPEGAKRLFTTYDGSYGRQPANDKNLNELDRLLEAHHMKVQGL